MNRINDYLVKKGKPMIHQGVEKNSKGNMENMIKKIQFIKKIVDRFNIEIDIIINMLNEVKNKMNLYYKIIN